MLGIVVYTSNVPRFTTQTIRSAAQGKTLQPKQLVGTDYMRITLRGRVNCVAE